MLKFFIITEPSMMNSLPIHTQHRLTTGVVMKATNEIDLCLHVIKVCEIACCRSVLQASTYCTIYIL